FRRGDWKTKAQDAIIRLGGALPAEGEVLPVPELPQLVISAPDSASNSADLQFSPDGPSESSTSSAVTDAASQPVPSSTPASPDTAKRNRRRGRRGGRKRRKDSSAPALNAPPARKETESTPSKSESSSRSSESRRTQLPVESPQETIAAS